MFHSIPGRPAQLPRQHRRADRDHLQEPPPRRHGGAAQDEQDVQAKVPAVKKKEMSEFNVSSVFLYDWDVWWSYFVILLFGKKKKIKTSEIHTAKEMSQILVCVAPPCSHILLPCGIACSFKFLGFLFPPMILNPWEKKIISISMAGPLSSSNLECFSKCHPKVKKGREANKEDFFNCPPELFSFH